MTSQRPVAALLFLAIGVVAGTASLVGGQLVFAAAALLLVALAAYRIRRGDRTGAGWLAVGAGASWVLILGRVILVDLADPAVTAVPGTAFAFLGGLVVVVAGLSLVRGNADDG